VTSPKFSVIIRTYNRAQLLTRAIKSVLNQTYNNYELLIIDDGSTDTTGECVKQFQDRRIRYHKHEMNLGVCQAANSGIELAQGEFISFLDSDDEWMPEMLENVFDKFQSDTHIGCVYTSYSRKNVNGVNHEYRFNLEGNIYKDALKQGYITLPTTLSIRKQCFDEIGGFDLDILVGEDDVMCLKLAKRYKFGLVKKILAIIHCDAGSRVSANKEQYAADFNLIVNRFKEDIVNYCGHETLARHYVRAGILFVRAKNRKMAIRKLSKSFKYGFTLKGVAGLFISVLPFNTIDKLFNVRERMLSAVK
jgi:glycosyltransferase involved in cell wall biosynthesis